MIKTDKKKRRRGDDFIDIDWTNGANKNNGGGGGVGGPSIN